MPGYQPRHDTDPVWFDGTQVNTLAITSAQAGVRITAIHGWDDRPDIRDVRDLRSGQDGEYADNLYLGGRTITIEGEVYGSTWADLQARKRALAATFQPSSNEALLKVPDPTSALEGSAWARHVSNTSPVAWWRLGETSGTTAADTIGTNHGTINGNPTLGVAGAITNDTNGAIDLDGTGDYIRVPYTAALNTPLFSVAFWFRRDVDTGGFETLVATYDGASFVRGWAVRISTSDTVGFGVGDGAAFSESAGAATITLGRWHHVAATFDGTSRRLYIDGVLQYTTADAYTPNTVAPLVIGARTSDFTQNLNGAIDEVAVWSSALTASEIAYLYEAGATGYTDALPGVERAGTRVVESIQFGDTLDPCCQVFQVVLRASDPRVYSDVETSTDSGTTGTASRTVTVDQGGTYETPTTITVTGPTSATWGVTEPTSGLSLGSTALALLSGESMAFDTRSRTATWSALYYRSRTTLSSIVAGWQLNETSGTTADNIQGSAALDMTYNGGFTLNQSGPRSGVPAVSFNGTTGYVSHAYSATLNPSTFTFEIWCQYNASGYVASTENLAQTKGWSIQAGTSLGVTIGDGASHATYSVDLSGLGFAGGDWLHVVLVCRSGEQRIYVNGVLRESGTAVYAANTTEIFALGRFAGSAAGYQANKLAGAFLYNSAFSSDEVADLYSNTNSTNTASGYQFLDASSLRWEPLATSSSTFTLSSSGLNTGSKLNVSYRDARV